VYGFYEIAGTQTYFYPFPPGYLSYIHAVDASNVVWFAGYHQVQQTVFFHLIIRYSQEQLLLEGSRV
jgi:hypothetical protein